MVLALTRRRELDAISGAGIRTVTDIAFDASYPSGGEPLTARQLGLTRVTAVEIDHLSAYRLAYNRATSKLQVMQPGGPFVIDEDTGTFAAGAAYTLKYRPGYILAVRGTAGSTGTKRIIPAGEAAGAGQVAVNFTTGVMTWGDAAITACRILYVPFGAPGFTADMVVVDEAAQVASNVITLANRAAAIQYIWNDEDNEILSLVPVGEAPSGAGCAVDINNGGATSITVTSGRITDGTATKVTYIKYVGNPLRFVDQADRTVTSNVLGPATDTTVDVNGLWLPGYGQVIVGETGGAANLQALLTDPDGAVGANVAVFDPWRGTITFNGADAYATAEIPLLYVPHELLGAHALEVRDGTNLAALTGVRLVASGY